ncbi:MAG: hypothetical protein ACYTEN_11375, partial [Planctomycetota bacterium]
NFRLVSYRAARAAALLPNGFVWKFQARKLSGGSRRRAVTKWVRLVKRLSVVRYQTSDVSGWREDCQFPISYCWSVCMTPKATRSSVFKERLLFIYRTCDLAHRGDFKVFSSV